MEFDKLATVVMNNGIGLACAIAVLWLAWYRETVTLPKMLATFAETQSKAMDVAVSLQREERLMCQKWHDENQERHRDNVKRLDDLFKEERETRHLVRDLAHTLGLRKAAEDEKAKRGHLTPEVNT